MRDITDSRRKFRIIGLRFPGKWINHEKLGGILAKSESFHVWFDKTEKGFASFYALVNWY